MEGPAVATVARRSESSRPPSSISSRVRPSQATTSTKFEKSSVNKSDGASSSPVTSRPRSVPAFWEGPLEVQSTAVPLATRSLSAHSSTASLSGVSSSSRQTGSSARQKRSVKRDRNGGSAKQPRQQRTTLQSRSSRGGPESKSRGSPPVVSDVAINGEKPGSLSQLVDSVSTNTNTEGFNIATHLQRSVEHSDGSSSPEIDQLLQDINAVLQSPSPDSSRREKGESVGPPALESLRSSNKPKRPKVAANFTGMVTSSEGAVSGSGHGGQENAAQKPDKTDHFKQSHHPISLRTTGPDSIPSQSASLDSKQPHRTNLKETISVQPTTSPIPDSHISEPPNPVMTRQHAAAAQIQRWYRHEKQQRELQLAEVQKVLQGKKDDLNRSRTEEMLRMQSEAETRQHQDLQQLQRRAAKMQAARKTAIEDLQRKREERREQAARIAQEEIALLQASGKIKRPRSRKKRKEDKRGHEGASMGAGSGRDSAPERRGGEEKGEAAPTAVIDEFFEAGDSRKLQTSRTPGGGSKLLAPSAPAHVQGGQSTYNDILETLKLLEAVPPPFEAGKSQDGGRGSADPASPGYLSAKNLQRLGGAVEKPLEGGKLQSILSYLDEMERADEELVSQLSKSRSALKTRGLPSPGAATSQSLQQPDPQLDTATAVATDVTTTILAQRMELDNKTKTVEMLQKALSQQRELTVYHAKEMEKEGQRRLELQQQEYETTVQRHQCFIDQLIDDKKVLSEHCEQLVKELREADKKFKLKIKTMEESHTAEVSKLKQISAAADKLRREKWRVEETRRIKEATVKGLEPEIQRIIARGKAEIQKLKALHEAELLQADERAGRRFVAQMEELRAQCAMEKEQACAHERELARQRYEKLAEQEELSYQQQRRKLFAEVQAERERVATQAEQQRAAMEREGREAKEEREREAWQLKEEHTRAMEEIQRRHNSELRALEERLSIEKQAWEENYMKKQETTMVSKEREMREALRQERDKEIEMVISHLEEETAQSKAECERASEARIKRIREKYEAELREVERSERSTLEKFNTMKMRLTELEGEVSRLCSLLKQRDREVERVSEVAAKLTRERDNVADIVRQEFADRLVSTEEENRQLKVEMSELRARHRVELERVGKTKEREMEEVHSRVRQALTSKEDNLRTLRSQHEAALKRADHLEMLLERQRKELLRK